MVVFATLLAPFLVMGGAVRVKGNIDSILGANVKNKVSEWNFYSDPKAASIVIRSKIPITLVPLDVTNKVPMTLRFYEKLRKNHFTPRADFALEVVDKLLSSIKDNDYSFWDPLAAVIATHPDIAIYQYLNLSVNPKSSQIIIDNKCGNKIKVAVDVDKAKFEELFLDALNAQ